MAVFNIIGNDNPIMEVSLSGISEKCDRKQLAIDLDETMENSHGLGLSANQMGIMERAFIMFSDFSTFSTKYS